MVPTQLTTENHLTQQVQILKIFRATIFEVFIDGTIAKSAKHTFNTNGSIIKNLNYHK